MRTVVAVPGDPPPSAQGEDLLPVGDGGGAAEQRADGQGAGPGRRRVAGRAGGGGLDSRADGAGVRRDGRRDGVAVRARGRGELGRVRRQMVGRVAGERVDHRRGLGLERRRLGRGVRLGRGDPRQRLADLGRKLGLADVCLVHVWRVAEARGSGNNGWCLTEATAASATMMAV